jgi:GT2 family glycosyltransferase
VALLRGVSRRKRCPGDRLKSRAAPNAAPATLDVVIVNWNGGDDVRRAALSALDFGARPIVVDNGSTDGSADRLEVALPEILVIRLGQNAGFARACNLGVQAGSGEYVLLLNPDAELIEGTVADMVRAFNSDASVAIVGPLTVDADGHRETSVRRFPTLITLFLYQLKLHRLARWIAPLRDYFMLDFSGDTPAPVDQVIGAAFAMRRRTWEDFGGLDEGFFLLFEEVDLCRRVSAAGRTTLYWPDVVVRHVGGTSFRKLSHLRLQRIWNASLLRYARLHMGTPAAMLLATTVPLSLLVGVLRDCGEVIRDRAGRHGSHARG